MPFNARLIGDRDKSRFGKILRIARNRGNRNARFFRKRGDAFRVKNQRFQNLHPFFRGQRIPALRDFFDIVRVFDIQPQMFLFIDVHSRFSLAAYIITKQNEKIKNFSEFFVL